jgi:hypothetical protein
MKLCFSRGPFAYDFSVFYSQKACRAILRNTIWKIIAGFLYASRRAEFFSAATHTFESLHGRRQGVADSG